MRALLTLLAIVVMATPAIAGPAMPLKSSKVITNAKNLKSYRWIDARDEATGLRLDGFDLKYGRAGIRIDGNASDIVIRNGTMKTKGDTKGSDLPVGIDLRGTVHNVLIENVVAADNRMVVVPNKYTNGDGFSTEASVTDITYRLTTARNNSDGGYDLKSKATVLDRTISEGNGRNYRFWGTGTGKDIVSRNPRGAHIWMDWGAVWLIDGVTFDGIAPGTSAAILTSNAKDRLTMSHCVFRNFPPKTKLHVGNGKLTTDDSCEPDAQGFVINTPIADAASLSEPLGFDVGEVLPDKGGDGIITLLSPTTICRLNAYVKARGSTMVLRKNDQLQAVGGTRYKVTNWLTFLLRHDARLLN